MTYTYEIEGLPLQTGDIICTMNGKPDILPGEFWRLSAGSCLAAWITLRSFSARMEDASKRVRVV